MSLKLKSQRFGRLVVLSFHHTTVKGSLWKCICDCGKTTIARADNLQSGSSQSCGCARTKSVPRKRDPASKGGSSGAQKRSADDIIAVILGAKPIREIDRRQKQWKGFDEAVSDLMKCYGGMV